MTKAHLLSVAIPANLWSSYPDERTFESLACDALGTERRIAKKYDLRVNHLLYIQQTEQIQRAAFAAIRYKKITHSVQCSGQVLTDYLTILQQYSSSRPGKRPKGTLLKNFFPPNDSVAEAISLLQELGEALRPKVINGTSRQPERMSFVLEQVEKRQSTYAHALKEGSAIIEIILGDSVR